MCWNSKRDLPVDLFVIWFLWLIKDVLVPLVCQVWHRILLGVLLFVLESLRHGCLPELNIVNEWRIVKNLILLGGDVLVVSLV